ncbi:unnamed protein product [Rotaria socialis]
MQVVVTHNDSLLKEKKCNTRTLNLPTREIRPRSHTIGNDSDVKHLQQQVAITIDIMHKNIQLGLIRGDNLDDLERRSSIMEEEAKRMVQMSRKVHQKYCWKNAKTWIIVISVVMIIIGIIMILMIFGIINKFID